VDCAIVGASTLDLDGPLGKVDLEWALDGGRSCLEVSQDELLGSCAFPDSTCVGSWDDVAWGDVGCKIPVYTPTGALSLRPWPVIISGDVCELAELRLR